MHVLRSWNFALNRDEKLYISGHGGSVKVSVKQKKDCSKKKKNIKNTNFMCFVLMKGWSTYAKQNKTLELQFWEKTSSAIRAILIIAFVKNRRLSAEGIFAWKRKFFAIFEKIKVVSITLDWDRFLGKVWKKLIFSTRNAPNRFIERLRLN